MILSIHKKYTRLGSLNTFSWCIVRGLFAVFLFVGCLFRASAQHDRHSMIFQIVNIKEKKGTLIVRLYDQIGDFESRSNHCVQEKKVAVDQPVIFVSFDSVTVGKYYVYAFQDVNGNGQLDLSLGKKAVEPFTYSRAVGYNIQENLHYAMRAEEVSFEYTGQQIRMMLKMIKE